MRHRSDNEAGVSGGVFAAQRRVLRSLNPVGLVGRVRGVRGLTVSVESLPAAVGASCRLGEGVEGRVVGFAGEETLVMPVDALESIRRGERVICSPGGGMLGVGGGMLGRVLDGRGRPIDGCSPLRVDRRVPIWPEAPGAMARRRIAEPLATGVRAIDGLLTVGRGQRMGVFSGSGVGKSVLLGMIARYTAADVVVAALIGERGREVRDFVEKDLGEAGLRRAVVVASTGEESPVLRVQAAAVAMAVAEYFRDRGRDVLLLVDSLTRLAAAQRQIGLAAGEPPASRGYPPSVFALLPRLLERAGRTEQGSITAFCSVLVEDERIGADPVGGAIQAVTDGHVVLSRRLARRGQFPAVDVLRSVSRVMNDLVDEEHRAAARRVRAVAAGYEEIEDMLAVGAYRKGTGAEYDLAVEMMPAVRSFLAQPTGQRAEPAETREALLELDGRIAAARRRLGQGSARLPRAQWR